jgi:hypothetical protein
MHARCPLLPLIVLAGCSSEPPLPCTVEGACEARSYDEVDGPVRNPERGTFLVVDLNDDLGWPVEQGVSLVNVRIHLDDYRSAPLPDAFLADLDAGFDRLRAAGLKAIVRFQYNDGSGEDATLEQMLAHIEQLAPVLAGQADVIAALQAGFIGAWGEWHDSSNGLDTDVARAAVAGALLAALPPGRMIQVRTPQYKDQLAPGGPLDDGSAFGDADLARVGLHDDCLLADDNDEGTYPDPIDQWRDYTAADSRFVPVGGEPCRATALLDCGHTEAELRTMHWSFLNAGYPEEVVAGWRSGGCYDRIDGQLGYRFVLRRSSWTAAPVSGGTLAVAVEIENHGYTTPFGRRDVLVVLAGPGGRREIPLTVDSGPADPRRWWPGQPVLAEAEISLADVDPGSYRLSVWLPDPADALRDRPEYAIRLANPDMWDPASGENVLEPALAIGP